MRNVPTLQLRLNGNASLAFSLFLRCSQYRSCNEKCGTAKFYVIIRNETANEDNERRLQQRNSQIFPFRPPPNLMLLPGLSSETPLPQGEATLRFIRQIKQKHPNVGCVFVNTVAGIRERSGKEKN